MIICMMVFGGATLKFKKHKKMVIKLRKKKCPSLFFFRKKRICKLERQYYY